MRKLLIAVVLCMAVEVVGGIKANSLAILTDATHFLSNVATFSISLLSIWAGGWEPNPCHSFGFFRIEILGAVVSMQLIWLLAGILLYEAISRLIAGPQNVDGFLIAAFGIVVNIIMALVLGHDHHGHIHGISVSTNHDIEQTQDEHHHTHSDHTRPHDVEKHSNDAPHYTHEDHVQDPKEGAVPLLGELEAIPEKKKHNINVHMAYLHVPGDSIQSVGVMIGGEIIWYKPEWKIVNLICTLIFSVIVLATTINML